ncbi:MAG: division/cell wall cluster transcriptional repressor MraZ [Anaerolineales bacterium]|nr:division/cell wall cluster transcriptional repressor MraZ [Anaerolineae bacterium]PWB74056.1 MAG: division/cell wall cluster transcriptional repressor MraZ [Anaerolineales bacterium]
MWEEVVESGRNEQDAGTPGVHPLKGIIAQMFLGQFQHNLDDKGRLMIPARYRDLLAAGAYITQGFDKCLMVMTDAYFKQVYDELNNMNLADPTARMVRRLILSNAYPVEVDKVGRILVPQNLRGFLGVQNGELTVAGQGEYFEVWTPAEWKTQMDKLQDVEANEQRFATLNLSKSNSV